MISIISWITIGLIVVTFFYAVFSAFKKKSMGLYIASVVHIMFGILSLPSIGLYVLGLAIIELVMAVIITIKYRPSGM